MQFAVDGVTHVLRMRLTCKNGARRVPRHAAWLSARAHTPPGLVKTHKLLYEECEMYQVVFDHTTARHQCARTRARLRACLPP